MGRFREYRVFINYFKVDVDTMENKVLKDFIENPSKNGTLMALVRNNQNTKAINYLIAWTNCGHDEALEAIKIIKESGSYNNYKKAADKSLEHNGLTRREALLTKPQLFDKQGKKNSRIRRWGPPIELSLKDFLDDPNHYGKIMTLIRSEKEVDAVRYILAWTNCSDDEAIEAVAQVHNSNLYASFVDSVKKIEFDIKEKREKEARLLTTHLCIQKSPSTLKNKATKQGLKNLYLIDGDNHINEATERIDLADDTDCIKLYFSQKGLYDKWKEKNSPHTEVYFVKSEHAGDQAVDNRIKEVLKDQAIDYDEVYVISHDKGYDETIQRLRCQLHRKKDKLDRREIF